VRFCDGSLVVPARVSTRDGRVGDGVTRIRHGHPRYDALRSQTAQRRGRAAPALTSGLEYGSQAVASLALQASTGTSRSKTVTPNALSAAGCKEAFLFTHEQNERALAVYASAGYRPDGSSRESDFRGTPCASCAW
jgi:hypothetical protein